MSRLAPSTQGNDTHEFLAGALHYRVTEYAGETSLPAHRHAHAKVTTALRGAYAETFPRTGRFDCNVRTVLMKPPDITHTDRYLGPSPALLTIDLAPAALEMVQSALPLFHDVRQTAGRFPVIGRMVRELEAPDTATGLALEALALELIVGIARRTAPRLDARSVFRRACEFMDGSLTRPVNLAALAAAAGAHPAHLSRIFRARAGCSPARWLRLRRIEVAKDLLRNESRSIADIALELGFYDQSHFTNVFVREVGVPPSRFRKASASAGREVSGAARA